MRSRALVLVGALLVASCATNSNRFLVSQFTISLAPSGDDFESVRDDRRLVYRPGAINSIACVITPPNDDVYEYVVVHYLPGIPKHLGGPWARDYQPADAPSGLEALPKSAQGEKLLTWQIEPGDPDGIYSLEIQINGSPQFRLEFEVSGAQHAAQQGAAADTSCASFDCTAILLSSAHQRLQASGGARYYSNPTGNGAPRS